MHFDREKPRFQVRVLEFAKDGITIKKSKNRNMYPNSEDLNLEQLWKKIERVVENEGKA